MSRRLPRPLAAVVVVTVSVGALIAVARLADPLLAIDFAHPQRHFRVEEPARLDDAGALAIYARIVDDMVAGYRLSRRPVARRYRSWRRYNRAPYRSATHGERFINNYANALARGYGRAELESAMPEGAILAKDSFAVTADGNVFSGPLFIMEKMAPGFDPAGHDWKYAMIMPDGSLLGETGGANAEAVAFCGGCHRTAPAGSDHLFFVPEDYRRPPRETTTRQSSNQKVSGR